MIKGIDELLCILFQIVRIRSWQVHIIWSLLTVCVLNNHIHIYTHTIDSEWEGLFKHTSKLKCTHSFFHKSIQKYLSLEQVFTLPVSTKRYDIENRHVHRKVHSSMESSLGIKYGNLCISASVVGADLKLSGKKWNMKLRALTMWRGRGKMLQAEPHISI